MFIGIILLGLCGYAVSGIKFDKFILIFLLYCVLGFGKILIKLIFFFCVFKNLYVILLDGNIEVVVLSFVFILVIVVFFGIDKVFIFLFVYLKILFMLFLIVSFFKSFKIIFFVEI